jgi:lipopolysaccharide transport system ATP-binding protein
MSRHSPVQKNGKELCPDLSSTVQQPMSSVIIVENLSKCYLVGHRENPEHTTFREVLTREAKKFARKAVDLAHGREIVQGDKVEEFWALKDVSFEVQKGDIIGIIGPNGAGKSTLLKILSRITEPTKGRITIRGRVASLLEVGTGFHPELTGRENVFVNGAILGMTKQEIRKKFDEIVDFAEIEPFLDTPVKRYSSGMYVRLAFAVAAHLDPEILIIDEVLAVGDVAFQKKCLGKIGDVASGGRTIFLVSHNMASILSLCTKALWLRGGQIVKDGQPADVVSNYLQAYSADNQAPLSLRQDRAGDGSARLISVQITNANGEGIIQACSKLRITISYKSESPLKRARFVIGIRDHNTDHGIFLLNSEYASGLPELLPAEGTVTCTTDKINLTPGKCNISIALQRRGITADYVERAGSFEVEVADFYGTGKLPPREWSSCLLQHCWSIEGLD